MEIRLESSNCQHRHVGLVSDLVESKILTRIQIIPEDLTSKLPTVNPT